VLRRRSLLAVVVTAALVLIAGPIGAEELDGELVLGDWIDDSSLQWTITVDESSSGVRTAAQPPAQKSSAAIEAKQKELEALKADTRHYWKNVDTGEILKQPRNQQRNPGLPY